MSTVLRANARLAATLGPYYTGQLEWLLSDGVVLGVAAACAGIPKDASLEPRPFLPVYHDTLALLGCYLAAVEFDVARPLMSRLLSVVGNGGTEPATPEVMSFLYTCLARHMLWPSQARDAFAAIFEPTLKLVESNPHEHHDHRVALQRFVLAMCTAQFAEVFNLPGAVFEAVMRLLISGCHQLDTAIREPSLQALFVVFATATVTSNSTDAPPPPHVTPDEFRREFKRVEPAWAAAFLSAWSSPVAAAVVVTMASGLHKRSFGMQVKLLFRLSVFFASSNQQSQSSLLELLHKAFPRQPDSAIKNFQAQILSNELLADVGRFKTAVRDFLLTEFGEPEENAELFEVEELTAQLNL
eukprot:TRINITY_DN22396_c0_g1_i1.p1 TRINITY_DN22396_c0_g1~~TRINITY_DN22396_c0_g1_i1.p1  ORF type:complete len:356 (+),score=124.75 TRINITY_DN22396_c0_g1_i1:3-1070(+)